MLSERPALEVLLALTDDTGTSEAETGLIAVPDSHLVPLFVQSATDGGTFDLPATIVPAT